MCDEAIYVQILTCPHAQMCVVRTICNVLHRAMSHKQTHNYYETQPFDEQGLTSHASVQNCS